MQVRTAPSHRSLRYGDRERLAVESYRRTLVTEGIRRQRFELAISRRGTEIGAGEELHRVSRPGLHARPGVAVQGGRSRSAGGAAVG